MQTELTPHQKTIIITAILFYILGATTIIFTLPKNEKFQPHTTPACETYCDTFNSTPRLEIQNNRDNHCWCDNKLNRTQNKNAHQLTKISQNSS